MQEGPEPRSLPSGTLRGHRGDHGRRTNMEGEHIPNSWVGRRVRLVTVVTADRTSQEEAVLLNVDQLGITVRRPLLAGSDEQEVVFHPWMHVYQLGPLIRE
jgi:hypothetical protein